jgi:hypothetical protein
MTAQVLSYEVVNPLLSSINALFRLIDHQVGRSCFHMAEVVKMMKPFTRAISQEFDLNVLLGIQQLIQ